MSVELLDTPRFYGFRVRRQIQGKTYQEYFSLKEGGKRIRGDRFNGIRSRAEARDHELASQQRTLQQRRAKEVQVHGQGQVRGILCRLKAEKSGNRTPVFQIGVMSLKDRRIVNTTVSINKFGVEEAWRRAVEFYADHKQINKRSKAYQQLLQAQPSAAQVRRLLQSGDSGHGRRPARSPQRRVSTRAAGPGTAAKTPARARRRKPDS